MHSGMIAVWDTDCEYTEKLSEYLHRQGDLGPSVVPFCDLKRLHQAVEHRQVAVAVVGSDAAIEPWLTSVPVVFLTEKERTASAGQEDVKEEGIFLYAYKYQSARQILRMVFDACRRETDIPDPQSDDRSTVAPARIRGIYSPLGGCLKTSLGLVMGCLLAEKKKCLFISLEAHSGFRTLFGRQYPMDLADLFAGIRRGEDMMVGLSDALQPFGKLFYIPPVIWPVDIREAEFSELKELLRRLAVSGQFDEIVVDVGCDLARPERILSLCDHIYRPEKEDVFSQAKLSEYDCYLRVSGCEGISRRTKRIPVSQLSAEWGSVALDQWQRWEQMLPAVRQILEETDHENRQ